MADAPLGEPQAVATPAAVTVVANHRRREILNSCELFDIFILIPIRVGEDGLLGPGKGALPITVIYSVYHAS